MKILIVHQYASQEKAALRIRDRLAGHDVGLAAVATLDDIRRLVDEGLGEREIVILTLGGRETQAFADRLARQVAAGRASRPLVVAMTVGVVLDRIFCGTYMAREPADVVFVNRRADVARVEELYAAVGPVPEHKVRACLCPIFAEAPAGAPPYGEPVRTVAFAAQTDMPITRDEREYIAQRLIGYARRHPDRTVVVKPKHRPGERSGHPQKFPYEEILARKGRPANLVLSYEPMADVIARSDLILTVSSTALVEAVVAGIRGAVVADLGVSEVVGTSYFARSGLLATFDEIEDDRLPRHDEAWLRGELDAPGVAEAVGALEPLARRAKAGDLPWRARRSPAFPPGTIF